MYISIYSISSLFTDFGCGEGSENNKLSIFNVIGDLNLAVNKDIDTSTNKELNSLITKYRTVFSSTSMGFFNVYMHQIDTGNHPHITQKPNVRSKKRGG